MAGARDSKAAQRRSQQQREAMTQERITLWAIGVLVAVAIIALAGVIWAVILPPRQHIITVGSQRFDASAVERRAEFLLSGANAQSPDDPIQTAIDAIRRDETLLQAGAGEAGNISDEDMTKAIRKTIGLADDASAEDYAKQYASFLKGAPLDKATFERMVRAQVIADRLATKFAAQVGDAGPQLHLFGVASGDQAKLKQFRDAVAGGADFNQKALELNLATSERTSDLGWLLPPSAGFLKDTAKLDQLPTGQVTEVLSPNGGLGYVVYRIAEREERRTYTEQQKSALGQRKVDEWVEQQRDKVQVTEDLSDSEKKWITKRVAAAAQKLVAKANAANQGKR